MGVFLTIFLATTIVSAAAVLVVSGVQAEDRFTPTATMLPAMKTSFGGVAVMIAFWLGTLPALLSVGGVARWLKHRFGRSAPRASAAVLLFLGGLALDGKLPAPAGTSTPPCHEASP